MAREASSRVAQGIQTPDVGTDFTGEIARVGVGDPGGDAAQLKSDRLRRCISAESYPSTRPVGHSLLPGSSCVTASLDQNSQPNRIGWQGLTDS